MNYIIKCDNGYYWENPVNDSIKDIVKDINNATVFDFTVELTKEIVKHDFNIQWRLNTCKKINGVNPRFIRVGLTPIINTTEEDFINNNGYK